MLLLCCTLALDVSSASTIVVWSKYATILFKLKQMLVDLLIQLAAEAALAESQRLLSRRISFSSFENVCNNNNNNNENQSTSDHATS
jgi:hypothetical protein